MQVLDQQVAPRRRAGERGVDRGQRLGGDRAFLSQAAPRCGRVVEGVDRNDGRVHGGSRTSVRPAAQALYDVGCCRFAPRRCVWTIDVLPVHYMHPLAESTPSMLRIRIAPHWKVGRDSPEPADALDTTGLLALLAAVQDSGAIARDRT